MFQRKPNHTQVMYALSCLMPPMGIAFYFIYRRHQPLKALLAIESAAIGYGVEYLYWFLMKIS